MTLPLIYLLQTIGEEKREEVKNIIKDSVKKSGLKKILRLFETYHIIELSMNKARELIADAKSELSIFPDSPAKRSLFTIADYTLLRKK